tara:strand:+ start:364 stop:618 length:255 start_codon:yes stop_codon:yes gene_type:complete
MPLDVGLKEIVIILSEAPKDAGPENPSLYTIVPDKSPSPRLDIATDPGSLDPIAVAIYSKLPGLTEITGVCGRGSTVTSSIPKP